MHQFNGGWRARDDLPCEPDHHLKWVRVGDCTGDENIRRIAVPFVGGCSAINTRREGYIRERGLRGFIRFIGIVGFVIGHRGGLQGIGCCETWNVEGGRIVAQREGQLAVVRRHPRNLKFIAADLGASIAQLFAA